MMLQNKFQSNTKKFELLSNLEWLESNGIGGYSSSSFCGVNTRKFHGLFVIPNTNANTISNEPPYVILSKFEEQIIRDDEINFLSTNQYPNNLYPQGFKFIEDVRTDIFPEFIYQVNGIKIKKTIAYIYGKNTLVIIYEVTKAKHPFLFQIRPLIANRDCTQLQFSNSLINKEYHFDQGVFHYKAYPSNPDLFIRFPDSDFTCNRNWYYNHEYLRDLELGENYKEDLFSPGFFSIQLEEGQLFGITISSVFENDEALKLFEKEKLRRENFISKKGTKVLRKLQISAEQFFIQKKEKEDLILLNRYFDFYHLNNQNTMLGLPGLSLATGRFSDFQFLLKKYSKNHLTEPTSPLFYNELSIQLSTSLKYLQYTENISFLEKVLLPILGIFFKSMNSFQMDRNPLFLVKEENFVRIISTFNSLKLSSFFFKLLNKEKEANFSNKLAERLKESFNSEKFFIGKKKESSLKGQLFSMSLPYPIHSKITGNNLLENFESYRFYDEGKNISHKNLIGEIRTLDLANFIEGLIKFKGNEGFVKGKFIFQNLMNHLVRSGKRTISEIIDFNNLYGKTSSPIMDANSTGEILRIGIEYGLFSNYFPEIPIFKNNIKNKNEWFLKNVNTANTNLNKENEQNPFSLISAFRDHSSSQRLYRLLSVFGIA